MPPLTPPREKKPKTLTPRQQLFVVEFMVDLNAAAAARRAGYAENTAATRATLWVCADRNKCPSEFHHVWDAIQEEKAKRVERVQVDADTVLQKLADIVNCDISQAFAADGSLLPIKEMPKAVAWLLAGFEGMGIAGYTEAERKTDEATDLREWEEECRIARASEKPLPRKPKPRMAFVTSKVKFIDRMRALELLGKHVKIQAFRDVVKNENPPQTIINNGPPIPQEQLEQLLALGENLTIVEALANAAAPAGAIPADDAPAPTPASPAAGHEPGAVPAAVELDAGATGLHSPAGGAGQEGQGPQQP